MLADGEQAVAPAVELVHVLVQAPPRSGDFPLETLEIARRLRLPRLGGLAFLGGAPPFLGGGGGAPTPTPAPFSTGIFASHDNKTVGPILEKAGQVLDDLTGGLLSELGDALTQLKNALMTIAAEEILTFGDIFEFFALKMRAGLDEQAFLWSDMLHYRRTSRVPQRLFAHARALMASTKALDQEHGRQLLAYAGGWVCHVGTDTIAHSFVNEQAGGPFRTHWQRHHLVENHMDAFNYERTGDGALPADDFIGHQSDYPSLNQSALYFGLQIPQEIDTLPDDEKQGDLRRHPLPGADGPLTVSIGAALMQPGERSPQLVMERSARALAKAQSYGGNQAQIVAGTGT